MAEAQPSCDLETWNELVQIDADIATAAAQLGRFGQRYVDDLADSYLAIGEKRYLAAIVAKIQRQAEDEARAGSSANPETPRASRTANDNARSAPRSDPEFDIPRWNELANEDLDIEAAIVAVGRFGSYYAADLAASYQAIDDKSYLKRIVETIIAEAQADLAHSTSAETPSATAETRNKPKSDSTRGYNIHEYYVQSIRRPGSSAQTNKTSAKAATERTRKGGADQGLAFTALGMFLFLFVVAAGLTLYDYSIFRAAHGDADRLEAYEHKCWVCAFASQARTEATNVRLFAAQAERLRIREAAVAAEANEIRQAQGNLAALDRYLQLCKICAFADGVRAQIAALREAESERARLQTAIDVDRSNYQAARGNIDQLTAYLGACQNCSFRGAAELELSELHNQANIAAAQARIAELQKTPLPQTNIPPDHVSCRIVNTTQSALELKFFSDTRKGYMWPNSNLSWKLNSGQTAEYNLGCQNGEKICYGASALEAAETWGVGLGSQPCLNCCIICDGALHSLELKDIDAFIPE